jgi:signal transduction histidine kinase
VRAQSQLWVAQKNLAITLHNDVQTTLIAAALHLKQAMESGSAIQDAIPDVRRLLNKALDIGVGPAEERGPQDVLTRANEKWGGLIEATLTISPAATELLAHDTVSIRIFEDLLVEFLTNSVKYGKAKEVRVELSAENERTLTLVMTNDGAPIDAHRTSSGLGARLLEALTLTHRVTDVPGGVRLTATIPIGAQVLVGADA